MHAADSFRLILFTIAWTALWVAPLPRLGRRAELAAGLIPFAAFGLRVFAGFFAGVPEDDPVRAAVGPLVDWITGRVGIPPYPWVLDGTVALGLAWLASAFDIPRPARIATAWIMPTVAALSWGSLWATGLPLERLLAARIPAPLLGLAAGSGIGAALRWVPSPIPIAIRRRAALVAVVTVPLAVVGGRMGLGIAGRVPPAHVAQVESIAALAAGVGAALVAVRFGGCARPRSCWLLALAVGVTAGAIVALGR